MLGILLLAVGIAGFGYGGYMDLKTTEFPDWLPYSMIVSALAIRAVFSLITADFSHIISSAAVGTGFLLFGLLLYYARQWGDGDAWLLGALGFLFPDSAGFAAAVTGLMPFPLMMFFNFFMISLVYLIAYSVFLGMRSPGVYSTFVGNLRGSVRKLGAAFTALLAFSLILSFYFWGMSPRSVIDMAGIFFVPLTAVLLLLFLEYARAVEGDLFKRKVPARKLRVGDVLVSDRWRGLTEAEVGKLQKKGGSVWIKEGVRFAPVFMICMLVTLFYGSLWTLLFPAL